PVCDERKSSAARGYRRRGGECVVLTVNIHCPTWPGTGHPKGESRGEVKETIRVQHVAVVGEGKRRPALLHQFRTRSGTGRQQPVSLGRFSVWERGTEPSLGVLRSRCPLLGCRVQAGS